MAAVSFLIDFGTQEKKICHYLFPLSICHEVMGLESKILVSWMLSFKPGFSFSYFTVIESLFTSTSPLP